jgi:hypothetical protein
METLVNSVELFEEDQDVFDIEVDIDHSFIVGGVVLHNSTLDGRTCPRCASLDGLQWTLDLTPIGHNKSYPGNTLHPRCRCLQIAVLKTWKELSQDDAVDGPRGGSNDIESLVKTYANKNGWKDSEIESHINRMRMSMDGKVAASMTYEDWLNTKSEAQQEEILGKGRAKLWRDKTLSLQQLTNSDNRTLTLDQLREKYGE